MDLQNPVPTSKIQSPPEQLCSPSAGRKKFPNAPRMPFLALLNKICQECKKKCQRLSRIQRVREKILTFWGSPRYPPPLGLFQTPLADGEGVATLPNAKLVKSPYRHNHPIASEHYLPSESFQRVCALCLPTWHLRWLNIFASQNQSGNASLGDFFRKYANQ